MAFAGAILAMLSIFSARSDCAHQVQSGRVVILRVYTDSLPDAYRYAADGQKRGWRTALAIMSAPSGTDIAWLESVIYSGMRGLKSSSEARYETKMAKMALQPTPKVLLRRRLGWHMSPDSALWGENATSLPTSLRVVFGCRVTDIGSYISQLDRLKDHIVIICGPEHGSKILSVTTLGGSVSGLLSSPTSRSKGVVSDTDIRGSVLTWLGIKPERTSHSWVVEPATIDISKSRCERLILLCKINTPLIWWVGVIAGVACVLLIISCLIPLGHHKWVTQTRSVLSASLAMLPLASCEVGRWIVSGYWNHSTAGWLLLTTCLVGGLVASLIYRFRSWAALRLVMLITVYYVAGTALLGYEWVYCSVISSYLLTGIRLYGIGNEFMGIVVGGCLMMIAVSGASNRLAFWLLGILAVVFAVGAWGANLGGFATCVSAMMSLYLYGRIIRGYRVGYGHALFVGLIIAVVLMPWPILVDSVMPVPTHMGEVAIRAELLGQNAITSLFASKLRLFWQILTMPFGIVTVVGFIVVLWYSTKKLKQHAAPEKAVQYTRWLGIGGFASVPALLFNDSGIVPAVIIMACVMIYALLMHTEGSVATDEQR